MSYARLNAFVEYDDHVDVANAAEGPLSGCRLAVKDLFDVAGYPTGAGNPAVRAACSPKAEHAPSVQALLAAGAKFIGKTHTDEFAYSMNGENVHYGTPVNPKAPGRIPGGSSSGSASAVAASEADIAFATDTGGSVRLPASYCGLIGLRATHGRINADGVFPLARSLDTVGWFARDMALYRKVGDILLGADPQAVEVSRMLPAVDIAALVLGEAEQKAFKGALERFSHVLRPGDPVTVCHEGWAAWRPLMRVIQAYEVWQDHGEMILREEPEIGPGVKERLEWARSVPRSLYDEAMEHRVKIKAHLRELVPPGTVLVFPTLPSVALEQGLPNDYLETYRSRSIAMLCTAGLAGLPQLTLPVAEVDGMPFGISLLGWENGDQALLSFGARLLEACG